MSALLHFFARALEPAEREAVLGDLAESGTPSFRNLLDLLGLIIRRQALIWTHWQPWIALIGVAGISGICLSSTLLGIDVQIVRNIRSWQPNGVPYGGLSITENVARLLSLGAAVFCWSAVDICVLRRLSGRAAWVVYCVFGAASLGPLWSILFSSLPTVVKFSEPAMTVLWILPVVLTLKNRWNATWIARASIGTTCLAFVLTIRQSYAVETWTHEDVPAGWILPLLSYLLAAWPAVFLWRSARGHRWQDAK